MFLLFAIFSYLIAVRWESKVFRSIVLGLTASQIHHLRSSTPTTVPKLCILNLTSSERKRDSVSPSITTCHCSWHVSFSSRAQQLHSDWNSFKIPATVTLLGSRYQLRLNLRRNTSWVTNLHLYYPLQRCAFTSSCSICIHQSSSFVRNCIYPQGSCTYTLKHIEVHWSTLKYIEVHAGFYSYTHRKHRDPNSPRTSWLWASGHLHGDCSPKRLSENSWRHICKL